MWGWRSSRCPRAVIESAELRFQDGLKRPRFRAVFCLRGFDGRRLVGAGKTDYVPGQDRCWVFESSLRSRALRGIGGACSGDDGADLGDVLVARILDLVPDYAAKYATPSLDVRGRLLKTGAFFWYRKRVMGGGPSLGVCGYRALGDRECGQGDLGRGRGSGGGRPDFMRCPIKPNMDIRRIRGISIRCRFCSCAKIWHPQCSEQKPAWWGSLGQTGSRTCRRRG